jgi:hypothetical protein
MRAMLMWTSRRPTRCGSGLGPPASSCRKLSGGGGSLQVPTRSPVCCPASMLWTWGGVGWGGVGWGGVGSVVWCGVGWVAERRGQEQAVCEHDATLHACVLGRCC